MVPVHNIVGRRGTGGRAGRKGRGAGECLMLNIPCTKPLLEVKPIYYCKTYDNSVFN